MAPSPSILVVIASYGTGNDQYLHRLLSEFRSMSFRLDLHVISNIPKALGSDVAVHVGLPTRNPHSLPFAHRRLFAEHLAAADYFIYCEDDTLVSEKNIRAFLDVNALMGPNEIPGFLRVERISPEECYVESAHGPYRWDPSSLVRRGSLLFGSFTNHHSAFTMASRSQVAQAIGSGGFLVRPHTGWGGMLECAASDLYTQCGLNRLVCISRIEDFIVPHLPNKNSSRWGIRHEEFMAQTSAFQKLEAPGRWTGSLLEVETRMTRARWSKNLYERPNSSVLAAVPSSARTTLSVGSGWGATEELLARQGKQVTGIPIDSVFADCLRRRGIEAVEGPLPEAVAKLRPRLFDVVFLPDVLHLAPDPARWLSCLRPLLSPTGVVLATVPRTFDRFRILWHLCKGSLAPIPRKYTDSRVQRVTRRRLIKCFDAAGLAADVIENRTTPKRVRLDQRTGGWFGRLVADRYFVSARPRAVA